MRIPAMGTACSGLQKIACRRFMVVMPPIASTGWHIVAADLGKRTFYKTMGSTLIFVNALLPTFQGRAGSFLPVFGKAIAAPIALIQIHRNRAGRLPEHATNHPNLDRHQVGQ